MTSAEAQSVNRLLNHLAGSIVRDAAELWDDVALLTEAATAANGVQGALDVEAILETLAQVGQRHADGGRA